MQELWIISRCRQSHTRGNRIDSVTEREPAADNGTKVAIISGNKYLVSAMCEYMKISRQTLAIIESLKRIVKEM